MATLVGRFRKLFAAKKQRLPSFIEVDVDPKRHWNILEDIGEGSFGAVKKVSRKTDPQQLAAFKCTEVQEGEDVEDLAIEVEILLACKHENVVEILSAYFYDNCLSVMLEYCEGGAVDQIMIELEKALTEHQIASILRQVCTGLSFLHSKFVIHRDLKAGNLLITGDGVIKIADFGVSCMLNGPDEGSNTFIGTPHWMSPEVIRCETMTNLLYNCKSDIWSLGITCIQLAQKEPPYHEMSAERVRLKILRSSKPPTLDRPNGYSAAFRDFITRCLVINPDERCSASDLLSHPFIINAVDKKPIMILLLEMSADFSEEPVFDNNGSCANSVCSSDSTSIWSRHDDSSNRPNMNASIESDHSKSNAEINGNGQTEFLDHERTPTVQQNVSLQSKKKRAAPAPPVEPKPDMKFVTVDVAPIEEEKKDPSGHMSPSGQEAMEILDDLNDVLDENYRHSSAESRPSSEASVSSPRRSPNKLSRPRLDSNPKDLHGSSESFTQSKIKFESENVSVTEEERTVIRCGTPTHSIKDITRMYSSDPNSLSPKSERSRVTSTDSDISQGSKVSSPSKNNQPVTLQVNVDDEESPAAVSSKNYHSQGSTDSVKVSVAAEIPSGLVKKNRELAQREQLADHAREEAKRIKAQRKKEDAAIFGEQHNHVSAIAATLSSKLTSGEGNQNDQMSHPEVPIREKPTEQKSSAIKPSAAVLPPRPPAAENSYTKVVSNQPFNYFGDENVKRPVESDAPPPEPPVDYDATPKATSQVHPVESTPKSKFQRNVPITKKPNLEKENTEPKKEPLVRRTPSRQTATKKTRTFTVDGVQVTSTTTHVLEAKQNYELRREQEREYIRMQREEARQRNGHEKKSGALQEQQEKIFMQEKANLEKSYQSDIDMISKTQKKKIEDIEKVQEEELKQLAKKLKNDQERQIRVFKDQIAREQKILKQEVDMLPKVQRKDAYRFRKDVLDKNQMEREMQFLEKLDREHEMFLDQLRANHRERVAGTERSFLEHKHKLEQSMMSALWELEERQLADRHTLNTQQLKELYLLQRSQMIARHQKEQEFVRRHIHEEEDRLMRDLSTNRKNLPKSLRAESKARIRMFKESLHIDFQHVPEKWDQFTQSFEENEKERVKAAIQEYELKCKKRMDVLIEENQRMVKELEQIHNEKRSMLCENEQQMLSECEQQFQQLLQEARATRPARKVELEKRFKDEMDKQMKFYNMASTNQMVAGMARCPVVLTDLDGKELSTNSLVDLSRGAKVLQIVARGDSDSQKFVFYPNYSLIGSEELLKESTSGISFCHFVTDGEFGVSAISTCSEDGITGLLKINGLSFILKPDPITKSFVLVPQGFDGCSWEHHSRSKRLASSEVPLYYKDFLDGRRRYIELVFLADTSMYSEYHSNKTLVMDRLHSIANFVDSIYSPLKIRVVLTWAGVWEGPNDLFAVSKKSNETLKSFSDFSNQIYVTHTYDHAQFITKTTFDDNVIGKAYKGTICTRDYSVGVISDHSDSAASVGSTVAHEMGHSLGMDHDHNVTSENDHDLQADEFSKCECNEPVCIMAASNGGYTNITTFSTCSLKALANGFRRRMDQCLFNVPKSVFGGAKCGNGIVEEGEECDCGNTTTCPNKCCIPDKCRLTKDAICASGDCCDAATCKPMVKATECRKAIGICDLPEYCDGETGECPPDFFLQNGLVCPGREFDHCYDGVCGDRTDQCKEIWGPQAHASEDICHGLNAAGVKGWNCGTKLVTTEPIKCEAENTRCGKVFCDPNTDRPNVTIGDPSSVRYFSHTTQTSVGTAAKCYSIETTYMFGATQKDITLVRDGAHCGTGRVCIEQKCTKLSTITEFVTECSPKDCSGKGVCNNVGNCHCEPGYGGVACDIPGYGGSINSGPATDKAFNAVPYLLFLLGFLTVIFLVASYVYHKRTKKFLHSKMWIWTRDTFHIHAIRVPVRRAPPPPGGPRRPNPNEDINAIWGDPTPEIRVGKGRVLYPHAMNISSSSPVADSNPNFPSPPIVPIKLNRSDHRNNPPYAFKPEIKALNPENRNGDSSSSEENYSAPPPVPPHRNVSTSPQAKPPPVAPKPVIKPKPKVPTKPPVVNEPISNTVNVKDLAAKFNAKNSNVDIL